MLSFLPSLLFPTAERPPETLLGDQVVVAKPRPPRRDLMHAAAEHLRIEALGPYHVVAVRYLAAVDPSPRIYHGIDPMSETVVSAKEGVRTLR